MHNSTSRQRPERQARHTRVAGLSGSTALVTSGLAVLAVTAVTAVLAAPSPAGATNSAVPVIDARTETATVCQGDGLAAWHFVIAPTDGTRQFAAIALDLDGVTHTFTDSMLVPNGGRTDDVFINVPPGRSLDNIVFDTSSATITPDTGDATVALTDACEGAVLDTATSSASSTGSGGTTEITTVAVLAPPVPCAYESGYAAADPACTPATTVEAVCVEIGNAGDTVRSWYRLTNHEAQPVTYEWVDGSATLDAGESAVVGTERDSIIIAVGGVEVAVAVGAAAVCSRDVEFTQAVVGPAPEDATYTMLVSRLVDGSYVPEGGPFQIRAGETVTIPIPSTFAPEGIQYAVTQIDSGEADASSVTPDSFVAMGHRGEVIGVTITNAYAAIELDKQVSKTDGVEPGDELVYTLVATNTGGVTLDSVVIVDRLPMAVTYRMATVVGGAGSCTLLEATQPQLVQCALGDSVVPGASTPPIELAVTVDSDVTANSVVNQAMVIGTYGGTTDPGAVGSASDARVVAMTQAGDPACRPTAGEVCAVSARIGSGIVAPVPPVPLQASAGPVPTSSTTSTTSTTIATTIAGASAARAPGSPVLPSTGNGASQRIALVSVAALAVGLALLLGSRRSHQAD